MGAHDGIGILGGTFDPVHVAHLRVAEEAREALDLAEVRLVPAADPPHKDAAGLTPARDRLAMVDRAVEGAPGLRSWNVELERPGPSYSVDTVRMLRRAAGPSARIVFLLGRDAFEELHTWKETDALLGLCDVTVLTRPPHVGPLTVTHLSVATREALCYDSAIDGFRHESGRLLTSLEVTRLDVSATDIRARVAAGRSIRFLVPPAVAAYIDQHRLYRTRKTST